MGRNRVITALLVTVFVPILAHASDDPGQALVEGFVTELTSFSASFEQSLLDPDGDVLESTRGTLEILRPGRFRWAYVEPYEQWLVADGLNIWSYDLDLAQVTVKPQAEALANTPAMLLGGSGASLDEFEFDGSYDSAGFTWVRMRPVDTDSGFLKLELAFLGEELTRMVFHDNLDQTTIVSLSDVVVDGDMDAGIFEFSVPDDVDVVGTPAAAATADIP